MRMNEKELLIQRMQSEVMMNRILMERKESEGEAISAESMADYICTQRGLMFMINVLRTTELDNYKKLVIDILLNK